MRLSLSLFGPFRATLDGRDLQITSRRARALLALLALAPAKAMARDRIAALLWPDRAEEQARASLRQELTNLRRLLGQDEVLLSADSSFVRLNRSELEPDVGTAANGEFLEGLDLKSEPFDDWRRAEQMRLEDRLRDKPETHDGPNPDIFRNPSVLVMGFVPASSNDSDTAFCTGLVIDLRNSLSLWRWFPVIGPEAIGWKSDRDCDLREAARSVAAAYAIGGAVRRAGERLRVSASLTHVDTGHLVWTDTFEGEMSDLFEMQEAIGRAVVARVVPEIERAESARVTSKPPSDMAVWQLMAQTDELDRTGGEGYGSPESNLAQVALLEEAIRRDPGFARAWARLGRYHFRAALLDWSSDRKASFEQALQCCERAVSLDPSEWEGQAYRALTLIFGKHALGPGLLHAQEAVRLNPSAPVARHARGCALEWAGEPDRALRHLRLIFDLNPNYPNRAAVLGDITTCELFRGHLDDAVAAARQLRDIAPDYNRGLQRVAVTLGHAGKTDEAAAALDRVRTLQPDFDADYVHQTYPYARPEHLEIILEGLKRSGWEG